MKQRCFERYHPRPPAASFFPKLGVCNPQNFSLLSQECEKQRTSNLAGTSTLHNLTGSIRTSPLKFCENSGGVSRDCPIFWVPPIISRMGKATNFKFCTHIHRIDRNKSPLKLLAKVAVGVLGDSRKFSEHHNYIGCIARSSAIAQLSCIVSIGWFELIIVDVLVMYVFTWWNGVKN